MKKVLIAVLIFASFTACTEGVKDGRATKAAAKDPRNPKDDIEVNIYRSGDSMMQAFKNKDWVTFTRYSHPTMVTMKGGEEAFVESLSNDMIKIPDSLVKEIKIGRILQVVKTPTDHQCVVEQNTEMVMESMKINSTTYLVGESLNGGKNWTFFDASNSDKIKPSDIKPNISPEIKVPQKKQDMKQL